MTWLWSINVVHVALTAREYDNDVVYIYNVVVAMECTYIYYRKENVTKNGDNIAGKRHMLHLIFTY